MKADKPVAFHVVGGDNHPMVFTDAAQLQHVLGNLIDNALKYSGTTVDITISLSDGVITVADNGIGIAKEKLEYIFDKLLPWQIMVSVLPRRSWSIFSTSSTVFRKATSTT